MSTSCECISIQEGVCAHMWTDTHVHTCMSTRYPSSLPCRREAPPRPTAASRWTPAALAEDPRPAARPPRPTWAAAALHGLQVADEGPRLDLVAPPVGDARPQLGVPGHGALVLVGHQDLLAARPQLPQRRDLLRGAAARAVTGRPRSAPVPGRVWRLGSGEDGGAQGTAARRQSPPPAPSSSPLVDTACAQRCS